jgi:hypothetical protein
MFVDLWVFGIFAILFGFCAIWNQRIGISRGVEGTLDFLVDKGVIKIIDDEVLGCPGKREKIEVEIKLP